MRTAVAVDLECSQCLTETVHQATMLEGRLETFRCVSCGKVTSIPAVSARPATIPSPFAALKLDRHSLGQGLALLEGSLPLPRGTFLQQGLEVIRVGHALRELDCKVLRLPVETADQFRLVSTLKVSTGLPVLVDIGANLALAPQVIRSEADGVVFTCADDNDAETLGAALSPSYQGAVIIRTTRADTRGQLRAAESACRILCRWNQRNLAVTFQAVDAGSFATLAAALRQRVQVPIRAELPLAAEADETTAGAATSLAVAFGVGGSSLVGLPALSREGARLYDIATDVLIEFGPQQGKDMLGTLVYMAGKAFTRVVSKPRRMLHEMESAPSFFAHSMPQRMISKPQRVMGEIRRLLRQSS